MKTAHHRGDQSITVLIATASQDDQHLIGHSLQSSLFSVELLYSSTAGETLACLNTKAVEYYDFPRLLLLDLEIAARPVTWQLLEQIRASYRLLPIVLISLDQQQKTILQAYNLGIHAFIHKSIDWDRWKEQLDNLSHYWLRIITLPKLPPL